MTFFAITKVLKKIVLSNQKNWHLWFEYIKKTMLAIYWKYFNFDNIIKYIEFEMSVRFKLKMIEIMSVISIQTMQIQIQSQTFVALITVQKHQYEKDLKIYYKKFSIYRKYEKKWK